MCQEKGCKITGSYNYPDEKSHAFCTKHKKDGMIYLKSKYCNYEGCSKIASYNFKGNKKGMYCATHREKGMIDCRNKICSEGDCIILATYNKKGEKQGLYCYEHKKDEMINVKHKRCLFEGCNKFPGYNYEDKKSPIYCKDHKKDGMISVTHRKCQGDDCKKCPSYNIEGEVAMYCFNHKKDDMVRVGHKRCCESGCIKDCLFGFRTDNIKLYCSDHKKCGMINLKNKLCRTPLCDISINGKYEDYCLRCYIYMFPDRPITRNYKTKERSVIEYITKEFSDKTFLCDKKVIDGCSKRRPDIFLDLGEQVIIVEVDENQHVDYDCSCENKRIMEISKDIGHRPLVFIRFNPDEYIDKDGKKITSCWGLGERGICIIKKTKRTEWNKRLECLKEQIQYWIDNKTEKTIEIVQLFYDMDILR